MTVEDFHAACKRKWIAAITSVVGPQPPSSMTWRTPSTIIQALTPFMGTNNNHGHLPTGGGNDFQAVSASHEGGCIDFSFGDRSVYIVKPALLTLEIIEEALGESFLLLDLSKLPRSGVDDEGAKRGREDVLEVGGGNYLPRAVWDRDYLRRDSNGNEVPIPGHARVATRWIGGKILFVSKGSMWNGSPHTYDGEHNSMTSAQIRAVIEKSI